MADYKVTDYSTASDSLEKVAADMETKLETLDSTTNGLRYIDIVMLPDQKKYMGIIIYDIP